jgi:GTP cyclohydrolase I
MLVFSAGMRQGRGMSHEVDQERIAKAVREILSAIGEDPDRDGLRDTPARVGRYFAEVCGGIGDSPERHLDKTFEVDHDEIIMVRDISFYSICEHHLVPFFGTAHVGYLPARNGRVTGLSKLARLVDGFAKRPQVQERLTNQIAMAIEEKLQPRGVAVVLEAEHLCMSMRGIKKPGSRTVTSSMRGLFRENPSSRQEVLELIHGGGRR